MATGQRQKYIAVGENVLGACDFATCKIVDRNVIEVTIIGIFRNGQNGLVGNVLHDDRRASAGDPQFAAVAFEMGVDLLPISIDGDRLHNAARN